MALPICMLLTRRAIILCCAQLWRTWMLSCYCMRKSVASHRMPSIVIMWLPRKAFFRHSHQPHTWFTSVPLPLNPQRTTISVLARLCRKNWWSIPAFHTQCCARRQCSTGLSASILVGSRRLCPRRRFSRFPDTVITSANRCMPTILPRSCFPVTNRVFPI